MFNIVKPGTNIDFVGKRKWFVGFSFIFIIASFVLLFTKGLNYGIDFSGGAEIQVQAPNDWDIGKLRSELEAGGLKGFRVVQIGEMEDREFLIKAQGDEDSLNATALKVSEILKQRAGEGTFEIKRSDIVGPAAGKSLRRSGFLAMVYAVLCILIYVAIRFDFRYAPGAVLALFHDSMFVIGILVLTQNQFDLTVLAALLALIGYSNNDTIIVYDRVRETLHMNPNMKIEDACNQSMNETFGRTLLTSISTFISAAALWLFGGSTIHDFAFTFMIGILIGTYSSIFIASPMLIFMTQYQNRKGKTNHHKSSSNKPQKKEMMDATSARV